MNNNKKSPYKGKTVSKATNCSKSKKKSNKDINVLLTSKYNEVNIKKSIENKQFQVEKETYPHFRYYYKSEHPALIVGEQITERQKDEYKYRKVMHGERDGKRLNEKLYPNPNLHDDEPMYIGKRIRSDDKKFFGKRLFWKYPKK